MNFYIIGNSMKREPAVFRQRFIMDTTAITGSTNENHHNDETFIERVDAILDLIAEARLKLDISCYIPYPSVYNELRNFLRKNNCPDSTLAKVDTWLVKKTPDRHEVKIPAEIFYSYVSDMRTRLNKGMSVAEEAIWEASTNCLNAKASGQDREQIELNIKKDIIGSTIAKFRERYRAALRYGILDSAPDLDVMLLAKELDAAVVSGDAGIETWSEKLGLRYVQAQQLPMIIEEYLTKTSEETR